MRTRKNLEVEEEKAKTENIEEKTETSTTGEMILFDKEEIETESYLIDDEFEFYNELDPELVHYFSVEGRVCNWELLETVKL